MPNRRPAPTPTFIARLGKVMNGLLLLVCGGAAGWAGQLFWARRALPYNAAGQYLNPRTGILYDEQIVRVALGLFGLFASLTVLLFVSAYRLYRTAPRRPAR